MNSKIHRAIIDGPQRRAIAETILTKISDIYVHSVVNILMIYYWLAGSSQGERRKTRVASRSTTKLLQAYTGNRHSKGK